MQLTKKQELLYLFLKKYKQNNGASPRHIEIAKHFQYKSLNSVQKLIKQLEIKGLIKKAWNHKRAIEIIEQPIFEETINNILPIRGLIKNNQPLIELNNTEFINLPFQIKNEDKVFAFKVDSNDWIHFGVLTQDVLVFKQSKLYRSSDIVYATLNNQQSYLGYQNTIRTACKVEGKLICLLRYYI